MPDNEHFIVVQDFLQLFEDIPKNHNIYFNLRFDGLIAIDHYDEKGEYIGKIFDEASDS